MSEIEQHEGIEDAENEEKEYRPLRIRYSERTCGNKFLRLIYKVYRIMFVSWYFYFIPFYAMLLTFLIPFYSHKTPLTNVIGNGSSWTEIVSLNYENTL